MADNRNLGAPTWVTTAGFGFLTFNSGLAIYRSWGDLVSILFVLGSYTTLLLLFRCLQVYEQRAALLSSPAARERARRAVWPLTTLLRLALGVVNCDMALIGIHKCRSDDQLGSASVTCVLVAYAALLALVWLLLREVAAAGHPSGVGCRGEATRK